MLHANWLGFRNLDGQAQLGVELINEDDRIRVFSWQVYYADGGGSSAGLFRVGAGQTARRWVDVVEGLTIEKYLVESETTGRELLVMNDITVPVYKA